MVDSLDTIGTIRHNYTMNSAGTILVTGNTYPVKDALKALGGRWDSASKGWRVPANNATAARNLVAPTTTTTKTPRPSEARPLAPGACHCGVCEGDGDGGDRCVRFWGIDY